MTTRPSGSFFRGCRRAAALAWCACLCAAADDVTVGWREAASVNVPSGAETFAGRLTVGDGGVFQKVGAGALTLPAAQIDRQAPWTADVLEGTLDLAPGAASADVPPPDVIAAQAAFWVDATPGKGLQTADDGGTTRVTRWCDVRETDPENRTFPSALPGVVGTGLSNAQTANPVVTTADGNAAVYFGGLGSGQHMLFKTADDGDLAFGKVFHFFLVHGVANTWGPVLGHTSANGTAGFRVNAYADGFTAYDALTAGHFQTLRGDLHDGLWTHRFTLNGRTIDAFREPPRKGFQLLAGSVGNAFQSYNNFFRQRGDAAVTGGDYLSEAILFTNRLSEAAFTAVERYLMAKWRLRTGTTTLTRLDTDAGRVGVAAGATVTAAPADGETVGPVAFSGEGTVAKSGDGTLVIGPSGDRPPFAGTFTLSGGGKVAVRGGTAPALSVAGGQTLHAAYTSSADTPAASAQAADGTDLTLTDGGADGAFVKTGAAEARVATVAADVSKITVAAGALVLAAPETRARYAAGMTWTAGTGVTVEIPNAGFEDYFAANPTADSFSFAAANTAYNGWKGSAYGATRYLRVGGSAWTDFCKAGVPPAEGSAALLLKTSGATAYTTVTLPQDGVYEFSCAATARINKGTGRDVSAYYPMGIWLGDDATLADAVQIGTLITARTPWPRTVCRFTAKAGTHVLGFKGTGSTDDGILVDDLTLRYVGEMDAAVAFAIPNGDFETYAAGTPHHLILNANVKAEGWTFDTSASTHYPETKSPYNAAVTLASSLTYALSYLSGSTEWYTRMFPAADAVCGATALAFNDANGKASTTFTAPAGTFRLKGRLANWPTRCRTWATNENRENTANTVVAATLTRADGTTVALGTVTADGHLSHDVVWPTAFTLDAAEEVTLTVTQTSRAVGLLDDLVLVDAATADAGELVVNGGFERTDGFTAVESGWQHKAGRVLYASDPANTGFNAYVGDYGFMLRGQGAVRWTLNIPAEGLYRLRFAAHERTSSRTNNGRNPVTATLAPAAGGAAATLLTATPFGSNFYEYSALFNVAAAGTYTLTLQGTQNADRRTYLDGVSVRRATAADTPSVPAKVRLDVAEGATLRLDFPGTLKVAALRLGGVAYGGVVDAAVAPDFISGLGALKVDPNGTVLVFR